MRYIVISIVYMYITLAHAKGYLITVAPKCRIYGQERSEKGQRGSACIVKDERIVAISEYQPKHHGLNFHYNQNPHKEGQLLRPVYGNDVIEVKTCSLGCWRRPATG